VCRPPAVPRGRPSAGSSHAHHCAAYMVSVTLCLAAKMDQAEPRASGAPGAPGVGEGASREGEKQANQGAQGQGEGPRGRGVLASQALGPETRGGRLLQVRAGARARGLNPPNRANPIVS